MKNDIILKYFQKDHNLFQIDRKAVEICAAIQQVHVWASIWKQCSSSFLCVLLNTEQVFSDYFY